MLEDSDPGQQAMFVQKQNNRTGGNGMWWN